ncbi:ABC transporter permease [Agrobacterium rhizogenes]|uniref:ABC transporter permease n=1 Tax=Rhizobium rhizogenes TaxID=359 RepID=UPI0015748292|nr:ABC transporter permease [Rhizobium rhizogenes]NTH16731.1 ABC transporter permease [Rhizobium rhizogenes]
MRLLGHKITLSASIGLAIITINALAAILGPALAPYGQAEIVGPAWSLPSADHWFGLDNLGRDVLSRILYGARVTIGLSILITSLSFFLGVSAGFAAAVLGRWIDVGLSRLADLMLSMPSFIFALVVLSVMGTDTTVLILTVGLLYSVPVFRLARAVAMDIVTLEYVEAAKLRGEGLWWIVRREILPNALPPLLAEFGLRFCFTFLFIAALSFLGLGIQPPQADWGSMVRETGQMIALRSTAIYPAVCIALMTIGINLVVDWWLAIHSRGHGNEI